MSAFQTCLPSMYCPIPGANPRMDSSRFMLQCNSFKLASIYTRLKGTSPQLHGDQVSLDRQPLHKSSRWRRKKFLSTVNGQHLQTSHCSLSLAWDSRRKLQSCNRYDKQNFAAACCWQAWEETQAQIHKASRCMDSSRATLRLRILGNEWG
jgi:hypothetical protein